MALGPHMWGNGIIDGSAWATGLKCSVWVVLDLGAVGSDTMDPAATDCCYSDIGVHNYSKEGRGKEQSLVKETLRSTGKSLWRV